MCEEQVPGRAGRARSLAPRSACGPIPGPLCKHRALSRAEWESQPEISTNVRAFNPPVRPLRKHKGAFARARLSSPNRSDLEPHARQECRAPGSCRPGHGGGFLHTGCCRPVLPGARRAGPRCRAGGSIARRVSALASGGPGSQSPGPAWALTCWSP